MLFPFRRIQISLPAGLATALDAVTEILSQRLRQLERADVSLDDKAHAEDLAVALEELNVVSEELSAQLRNLGDEHERSAYFFDAAPYPYFITDLALPAGSDHGEERLAHQLRGTAPQKGRHRLVYFADHAACISY